MRSIQDVTRFELIDHRKDAEKVGRTVAIYAPMKVQVEMQDNGRTMKVFLMSGDVFDG